MAKFVGASGHGEAGFGKNLSRRFGFNAEYMYYALPLKTSVIANQFLLPGATGNVQSGTLNGIVKAPFLKRWGTYGIFGVGWYERNVSNRREPLAPGTPCQPAWRWWDLTCVTSGTGSPPVIPNSPAQAISSNSKGAGGFNAGGWSDAPFQTPARQVVYRGALPPRVSQRWSDDVHSRDHRLAMVMGLR